MMEDLAEELTGPVRHWWDIGFNQALPEDLLIRLLDVDPGFLCRKDLPPAVVDAAVDHPDRAVRGTVADRHAWLTVSSEQWGRLLLNEREGPRRALFVEVAAGAGVRLASECREALVADPSPLVRAEAALLPGMAAAPLRALAADSAPRVRAAACAPAWPHLDRALREALLADADEDVRTAALLRHHQDVFLGRAVFTRLHGKWRSQALHRCRLEASWSMELALHSDVETRRLLAGNALLDGGAVAVLLDDEDETVRAAVAVRADLTEEQRASVLVGIEPDARHPYVLPWVEELHDDPQAMRRLASSAHPHIRSSVARAPRLPPDVVERLAGDTDRTVRLFLAESCEDAPADALLEVWHWWDGSLGFPGRPRSHPNFPRTGLLRFATHPQPRLRRLALSDPASAPELVERFSRDESAEVRREAAEEPRLSPATAVRLLDDPDPGVRARAAGNPATPPDVLLRLLGDPATARDASFNPALPLPVMRRMVDLLEQEAEASRAGTPSG
ncbi:PE-PGRS family protein [Streptomyces sp. NPDC020422]|uniref:PE-PGRS family protein n=1 Tax=Streptomyces sp. NPDC020422 TaxID=3365074 RepID=UPI00379CFE5D